MKRMICLLGLLAVLCLALPGCSKDKLLEEYDSLLQTAGALALTNDSSLTGTRTMGETPYTGTYRADYQACTKTECLFGGTGLSPAEGEMVSLTYTIAGTAGQAQLYWVTGSGEAVPLLEGNGVCQETIRFPAGSNYLSVACQDFTGEITLALE